MQKQNDLTTYNARSSVPCALKDGYNYISFETNVRIPKVIFEYSNICI